MKKKEVIRYSVDPFNRLVAGKSSGKTRVYGFRHIIDGEFKADKNNSLSYHLKSPSQSRLPQQLKLKGNWSLDKNHNLVFALDKESYTRADKLTLQSELINADSDKIAFSLGTRDEQGRARFYLLELNGRWQADKYNRLSFRVSRKGPPDDEITLNGAWQVNKRNQLVYTYIRSAGAGKKKSQGTITFKGSWDISKKHRISYILNRENVSGFDFSVSLGEPLKNGMRYEIGIGAAPKKKRLILFGRWKLNKKLGIILEMPREDGRIKRIAFGAECKLNADYTLEAKLKSYLRRDLGIDLKLSRSIAKNLGEAFLRALREGKEISLTAGAGIRW